MGIRTELRLRLPNSPGAAASVCRLLADARVDIMAMTLDTGGHLHLLVDNHNRAIGVLRERHPTVNAHDVLYVPVSAGPGGAAAVLELLAEAAVNVDYAYCGTVPRGGVAIVIGVEDPQRAATVAGL